MLAYQMNGADIPMLNGYPVRLVVPGYYGTYWVKHLSDIQVIDSVYDGFWMKPAYRIPDNDCACVEPGTAPAATRPIGRFNVRSFITSLQDGARVRAGQPTTVRGIAFDGGRASARSPIRPTAARPGARRSSASDLGRYSFREFTFAFTPDKGSYDLRVRAWNRSGQSQPTGRAVAACRLHAQRRRACHGHCGMRGTHDTIINRASPRSARLACTVCALASAEDR